MSKWDWALLWVLMVLGIGVVIWADKGSYLNAVVTGQCNACPAPPVCTQHTGYGRRGGLAPIDGCNPPWWRRHAVMDRA